MWADVTLQQYIAYICNVEPTAPAKLKAMQQAAADKDRHEIAQSITGLEYRAEFYPFFIRVICHFSDIAPEEIYDQDATEAHIENVEKLYLGIIRCLSKQPEQESIHRFVVGGAEYWLPVKFMSQSKFGEYVEAAQFETIANNAGEQPIKSLAKLACVLLKKDGEKYNGDTSLERESFFLENLTMWQAWQIGFFLSRQNAKYKMILPFVSLALNRSKSVLGTKA